MFINTFCSNSTFLLCLPTDGVAKLLIVYIKESLDQVNFWLVPPIPERREKPLWIAGFEPGTARLEPSALSITPRPLEQLFIKMDHQRLKRMSERGKLPGLQLHRDVRWTWWWSRKCRPSSRSEDPEIDLMHYKERLHCRLFFLRYSVNIIFFRTRQHRE